jgi:hypothetical protein
MTQDTARLPAPSFRKGPPRYAYCPICGGEHLNAPSHQPRNPQDGLCPGRCTTAWQALALLRTHESQSEALATGRKHEWEPDERQATSLSELLLEQWRARNWTVVPEDILRQLPSPERAVQPDPSPTAKSI